ncbi:MAG: hypothetical protein ABI165_16595, partial [Bryobacteraceae bacterium]
MAVFQWMRPAMSVPSKLADLAAAIPNGVLIAYGNYVLEFSGATPDAAELQQLYNVLPRLETSPLPVLRTYLPPGHLIPNSQRYIVGPVSLDRFDGAIPPSAAAFHLGAEAQLGRYRTPQGDFTLAIFDYPTPGIARERAAGFQKLFGAIAKRTGSFVAVIFSPPDPDAAERVLARVQYSASIALNADAPPPSAKKVGTLFMSIFALAGVVVALCVGAGIAFGGMRVVYARVTHQEAQDPITLLHLGDK